MDKIRGFLGIIQHVVLLSTLTRDESTEGPDIDNSATSTEIPSGLGELPEHIGSLSQDTFNKIRHSNDSGFGSSNAPCGTSQLSCETLRDCSKFKLDKTAYGEVNNKAIISSEGNAVSRNQLVTAEKTTNQEKKKNSENVLPRLETTQCISLSSLNNEDFRCRRSGTNIRNPTDGSKGEPTTIRTNAGASQFLVDKSKEKKTDEKRKDEKRKNTEDHDSDNLSNIILPDIFATVGRPLVQADQFCLHEVTRGPGGTSHIASGTEHCSAPKESKKSRLKLSSLKHRSNKNKNSASENQTTTDKKLMDYTVTEQDKAKIHKQRKNRSSTALGRWIKKRSNGVAPAPLYDIINEASTGASVNNEVATSLAKIQCKDSKFSNTIEVKNNKGRLTIPKNLSTPHKTLVCKERLENNRMLLVKHNNKSDHKTKEGEGLSFEGKECFSVNRDCPGMTGNREFKRNLANSKSQILYAQGEQSDGVTWQPTYQENSILANRKPCLPSINEEHKQIEDVFTNKLRSKVDKKRHGLKNVEALKPNEARLELPNIAKMPLYPDHWGSLPRNRPSGRGGHGFCLGVYSAPTDGKLFSDSSSEG